MGKKIKIFEYLVSKYAGSNATQGYGAWKHKFTPELLTPNEDQEREVNAFMENHNVIDINIMHYQIISNGNGGCHSIVIRYTITYTDSEIIVEEMPL